MQSAQCPAGGGAPTRGSSRLVHRALCIVWSAAVYGRVTARRLKDKGVSAGQDLPDLETIDQTPRPLGAPQLTGLFDDAAEGSESRLDAVDVVRNP